MSEFPHDDFAKDYLPELLKEIGTATPNKVIQSQRREGDLWFEPHPDVAIADPKRQPLGLIGQLLTRCSLIEVFRNAAPAIEIQSCQGKLIDLSGEMIRAAKRRSQTLTEEQLPFLWLIMPTASAEIRAGFGFQPTATPGVYELPKFNRTGLIVIHQLEVTEETLWLRVLGRSGHQARAIEELMAQPQQSVLYNSIEEILANYRAKLENRRSLTQDEEELIMNLSTAYLKKQEEWKDEGKIEGKTEAAIGLLREGISLEIIARALELSIETVQKLQAENPAIDNPPM